MPLLPILVRFATVLIAALAAVHGSAAFAYAPPADRAAALEQYLQIVDAARVPAGWTGQVEGCVQGVESPASIEATLSTVNKLRDFAGLGAVAFDSELNRRALAAALMMRAANNLSHSPGTDWPCYTPEGDAGAGHSNLAGSSGARAILDYVRDASTSDLGHRRWVLDPSASQFGTGSTGASNALYVFGAGAPSQTPAPELVAWPPAGFIPWGLVYADWSAAISVPGTVDLSQASVSVTIGDRTAEVSDVRPLSGGYGTGATLGWRVATIASEREADHHVDVVIRNVLVDGAPREFAYSFTAFPVLPPEESNFTGSRASNGDVTATWDAARERGVPVTGYVVIVQDWNDDTYVEHVTGPEARQLRLPFGREHKVAVLRVIPLSRAGSPRVVRFVPLGLPAEPAPPRSRPEQPSAAKAPAAKALAKLRVKSIRVRAGRVLVSATLTRRANGGVVRLVVRGGRSSRSRRAVVRDGRVRCEVGLSRPLRRVRPLRLLISYAGSRQVAPASATHLVF